MRGPVLALQMLADNGSWKVGVGTDIIKKPDHFRLRVGCGPGVLAESAVVTGGLGIA